MSYHGHTCKLPPMQRPVGPCPACDYERAMDAATRTEYCLRPETLKLVEIERLAIIAALTYANGNRTKAAALLGINVRTLRRKLKGTMWCANPRQR